MPSIRYPGGQTLCSDSLCCSFVGINNADCVLCAQRSIGVNPFTSALFLLVQELAVLLRRAPDRRRVLRARASARHGARRRRCVRALDHLVLDDDCARVALRARSHDALHRIDDAHARLAAGIPSRGVDSTVRGVRGQRRKRQRLLRTSGNP